MSARRWAIVWVTATALVAAIAIVAMTSRGTARRSDASDVSPIASAPQIDLAPPVTPAASVTPVPPSTSPAAPEPSATPTTPKPTPTPAKPSTTRPPANIASRLKTLPASTAQVIIVHAPTAATTHATLETYDRVAGVWVRQFAPMSARIGKDGFSDHHKEYVPNTPTGVYGFGDTMYGINSDPGVKYKYHRLVTNDWWNENPDASVYNQFEHTTTNPGGASEALWKATNAYQYFAFILYNVPAIPGAGSAVFLHVAGSGPTAGCVSLPKPDLIKVLTWLDPSKNPRIVLGPDGDLHRY